MITDTNKNIGAIAYNYLNLPTQATIEGPSWREHNVIKLRNFILHLFDF
ncbi:hypothetical protein [Flavobacterium sp. LB2P53]|nr:hypothetical protein [Flavobacterium sp. LB2P53]